MTNPSTFSLPCVRILETNLGKIDAAVECTELAVREFITNCFSAEVPESYIQELSKRHSVRVNSVNLDFLKVRVSQLNVIAVYQQCEDFLENFRDEHPLSISWNFDDGDGNKNSLLKRIVKNLAPNYPTAKNLVGPLEVDLFEHYRLVRNRFVHPKIDHHTKIDSKVPKLRQEVGQTEDYNKLNAPNIYHEISFDDFILFTRVIKNLAHRLCNISRPTDDELAQAAIRVIRSDRHTKTFQKLKRLGNNPQRTHNLLKAFLREMYKLDNNEVEPVIQIIQKDLLA